MKKFMAARDGERYIRFENRNVHAHFKNAAFLFPILVGVCGGIVGAGIAMVFKAVFR